MTDETMTLSGAFQRLESLAHDIEDLPGSDSSLKPKLEEALSVAGIAQRTFDEQFVFSSNETADDINTKDLRYYCCNDHE